VDPIITGRRDSRLDRGRRPDTLELALLHERPSTGTFKRQPLKEARISKSEAF
jgi:hypothetical protein